LTSFFLPLRSPRGGGVGLGNFFPTNSEKKSTNERNINNF
jgi:hypothetical protein